MHRLWILALFVLLALPLRAQDGLNLPAELYVLRNEGVVERYGIGAGGVQTVTPEGEFVLDFRVAPDNIWIAYRTLEGLKLANMFLPGTTQLIEGNTAGVPEVRGRGETLAWSPAADALAYTTLSGGRVYFFNTQTFVDLGTPGLQHLVWSPDGRYLAAEAAGGVWWIFRREATAMTLTSAIPAATGAVWAGLTQMIFAPPEGGLIVMDMASANAQTVLLDASAVYRLPYMDAMGTLLVFAGTKEFNVGQLVRVTFGEDGPRSEVVGTGVLDLTNTAWSPLGVFLIAFQGGVLALVEPYSGTGFTLPIASASAYSWGMPRPPEVESIRLPEDGYVLAPGGGNGAVQVWRLPRDGSLPATMTPALNDITQYAVSADGKQVAYVSNGALWWHLVSSSAEPTQLLILGTNSGVRPAFSPDGRTLYYRDEQPDGKGIWRSTPVNHEKSLFIEDTDIRTYGNPRPAGGVSAIAVTWEESGAGKGMALFDTNSGERLLDLLIATDVSFYRQPDWLSGSELIFGGTVVRGEVPIVGLHVLDVNNLVEPPFTVFPVAENLMLLDIVLMNRTTLRALIQQTQPGQVNIVDIPLEGGTSTIIGSAGFITEPRLSQDGTIIMGSTHPGGFLVMHTIRSGERVVLSAPGGVSQFRWR